MTGRLVDSYTIINTVKLFSSRPTRSDYTKESMSTFLDTVYPQMRLVTRLNVSVWILNSVLIFSVGALSIALWLEGLVSLVPLPLRLALIYDSMVCHNGLWGSLYVV